MKWQDLERHVIDVLVASDFKLDRNPRTGDCFIVASPHFDLKSGFTDFNITAFTQDLHKRISK